jgi:rhodanese-related sulfurtransferase
MISKRFVLLASAALLVGLAIAGLSLRGEPSWKTSFRVDTDASRLVPPEHLETWIVEGRRDFTVIDLRDPASFEEAHVKGAVNCGSCHESRTVAKRDMAGEGFVDLSKKLVLYTQTGREDIVLPRILRDNPHLYRLAGGYEAWQRDVLAKVDFSTVSGEALEAAKRREALRAYFSGERPVAAPAKLSVTPVKRTGEHKVAAANEGC